MPHLSHGHSLRRLDQSYDLRLAGHLPTLVHGDDLFGSGTLLSRRGGGCLQDSGRGTTGGTRGLYSNGLRAWRELGGTC